MKFRYIIPVLVLAGLIGVCFAHTYTPDSGIFAFREVEVFTINSINFTVPTDYHPTSENATQMNFKNGKDKLKISVTDNGTVKKVKKNPSKNITSANTMLGSVEGYLVDRNSTYTFSYFEGEKLVVIRSNDMALMMGVMGND